MKHETRQWASYPPALSYIPVPAVLALDVLALGWMFAKALGVA